MRNEKYGYLCVREKEGGGKGTVVTHSRIRHLVACDCVSFSRQPKDEKG